MKTCKICSKDYEDRSFYYHLKYHGLSKLEYQIKYEDLPEGMIKCEICGVRAESILTKHIMASHNMTVDEYQKRFPTSKVFSDNWKQMMSERNKSEKMRQVTIKRNKEDHMREAVANRNKDVEFRRKVSEGIKNSDKFSDGISRGNLKKWKDPKYALKMLDKIPNTKYSKRRTYYSCYFNREFRLKSYSEESFIILCEDMKVDTLVYETIRIGYIDVNGLHRSYYPDFVVSTGTNIYIVEVKWDESSSVGNNLFKSTSAIKYCNENGYKYCWYKARYNKSLSCLDDIVLCSCKIGLIAGNS